MLVWVLADCQELFTEMYLYVQRLLNNIPQMYSASFIWLALYSVMKLQTIY